MTKEIISRPLPNALVACLDTPACTAHKAKKNYIGHFWICIHIFLETYLGHSHWEWKNWRTPHKVMMKLAIQLWGRHVLCKYKSFSDDIINALVINCISTYCILFSFSANIPLALKQILLFALAGETPVPVIVLLLLLVQWCHLYGVCCLFGWYVRPQILHTWTTHSCSKSAMQCWTSARKVHSLILSIRSVVYYQYKYSASLALITYSWIE